MVSIITPVYNGSRFIEETIESVRRQTHQEWEMLVVDDCSSDKTPAIVERISKMDPRVHLLRHKTNGGPARARNTALEAAKNPLVAYVDSDDVWLPEKLERQLAFMRETGAAFSFTGFRRMDEHGGHIGLVRPIPAALTYHDYLKNTAIVTSTVLIDREQTGDFRMPIIQCDDFGAWLSILKRGHIARGLQQDLLRYRVVSNSISRNKARWARGIWRTYRDLESLSLSYSAWCFANYAWRGFRKYRSL